VPPPQHSIVRALALELEKLKAPAVLRYDISRLAWHLYKAGTYEGRALSVKRDTLDQRAFLRLEKQLAASGVLKPVPGLPARSAYSLIGGGTGDRNATICAIDPFCYLSHLSAMEFHALTDRLPEQLYVSSPAGTEWTAFALERMGKDLGDDFVAYKHASLPLLRRTTVAKLNQRPVHRYASVHRGAYRSVKDSPVRVATLGRTFLDMLREPGLCGGIAHVIDVFQEHAAAHRRLIFDEVDRHGADIDKVRAGFILESICKVTDPRIDAWVTAAARGGSRKLDPSAEYAPTFSERWALSINVPRQGEWA
jgi:predicted transcriptional regulator of viral defense system